MTLSRSATSIAQVMIVVAIAATLSSFTLGAARSLEIGSKRAKTQTILATLAKGMSLTVASRGALLSPSEHPLAGSRPGRADFLGIRGRTLDVNGALTGGELRLLDRDREGITGVEEWFLTSDHDRVLMAEDRYADRTTPHLYAMTRGELGVIGDPQQCVTRYRRLMRPPSATRYLRGPYDASTYADRDHLVQPDSTSGDGHKTFDYLFGSSNVQSELLSMGAISAPIDDRFDHRLRAPSARGGLDNEGRVWSATGPDPRDGDVWYRPGLIQDGVINLGPYEGEPDWKAYRLRGLAVYDAWHREILYSINASGAVVLQSAGYDGVFRFTPGPDGNFQTDASDRAPEGDDQSAEEDNLRVEMVQ
ncbi:MAG: hypothetical protein H0X45_13295 [Planctomycetes bacterium]|nr:hypothetical protein [Planctomycetota bacterium]